MKFKEGQRVYWVECSDPTNGYDGYKLRSSSIRKLTSDLLGNVLQVKVQGALGEHWLWASIVFPTAKAALRAHKKELAQARKQLYLEYRAKAAALNAASNDITQRLKEMT